MSAPPPPASRPPAAGGRRPGPSPFNFLLALAALLMLLAWLGYAAYTSGKSVKYNQFLALVEAKKVKSVTVVGADQLVGVVRDAEDADSKKLELEGDRFSTRLPPSLDRSKLADDLHAKDADLEIQFDQDPSSWVVPLLTGLVFALLAAVLLFQLFSPRMRDPVGGGFINNYVKSPARRYERGKARVTFEDVADMKSAKGELQEVVDFLRSPEKFAKLGAQVPKGVLLVGPPGTGKTLLARAAAGEAGVPFFSISGSEFIQMFVGVGASRVRDMFKTARESAPCLLFIDEIDAVGRMRGAGVGGGSDEREQTLNQILSEMDGFTQADQVIVLAATNRPDVLDSALLRPGRFDRHVTVDRPTASGRLEILKVHTRNKPLADDVDLAAISKKLIGMTGADLRNLANEAALLAARKNKTRVDRGDFDAAADRVLIGPKREDVLNPADKKRTAYHEAGHALVCWMVPAADKPIKVSIIPRGRTGGVNLFVPEEERYHHGLEYFKAKLVTMMGGRAADRLVYGEPCAGAEMDIKQATRLARYMVTHWGMSDRVGPMSFRVGEEHVFLGKEIQEPRDFSEGTAQVIDEEVQKFLREADEHAYRLLTDNRGQLDRLADALVEREEMDRPDIERLLFGVAGTPDDAPGPLVAPGTAAGTTATASATD